VGEEPVDPEAVDFRRRIAEFCREIETYLCKKNDGHLIRVVGPSFDLVSAWAERGVPLKVAFAGIDRYFERYYRNGPRRRPVKIDFCEADVLDVFDEWRRATGVTGRAGVERRIPGPGSEPQTPVAESRRPSLPAHLERVLTRLTAARASGVLNAAFDGFLDRVAAELGTARSKAGGLRGDARATLVARLGQIDAEMLVAARDSVGQEAFGTILREAEEELAPFLGGMSAEAHARAQAAAIDRLLRGRLQLPTVLFE
jgi:hypothetical protein